MTEQMCCVCGKEIDGVGRRGTDGRLYCGPDCRDDLRLFDPLSGEASVFTSIPEWVSDYRTASSERRVVLDRMLNHGVLVHADGAKQSEGASITARVRLQKALLGEQYANSWEVSRRSETMERRWIIPRLWEWAICPVLYGQKGAGKTTIVIDLLASLLIPDHKFLGLYEVLPLDPDDSLEWPMIVVINTEVSRAAYEEELVRAGLDPGDPRLRVYHLRERGGPQAFDLTDLAKFEEWVAEVAYCEDCAESGEASATPTVLICDNMTTALDAAGKDTEGDAAHWYHQFRRLMAVNNIPNGLVVAHAYATVKKSISGYKSMTGNDGSWFYMRDDATDPRAAREFSSDPRLVPDPLPPAKVQLDSAGLPKAVKGKSSASEPEDEDLAVIDLSEPARKVLLPDEVREAVLAYVARCNDQGFGPSTTQVREAVPGDNRAIDAALESLLQSGDLEARKRAGRGGGFAYWLAKSAQLR